MKLFMLIITLFLSQFYIFCQDSTKVKTYTFISFGLNGASIKSNAEEIVKKKWHIKNDVIAGCLVTEDLIKNVSLHNDSVKKQIAKVYGDDWEVKYNNEIRYEEKKLSEISEVLNKDPKVIQKKERYKGEEDHLKYKFVFDEKSNLYKIYLIFNESEEKNLLEFEYDFDKKKYSTLN